jgi:hypothetical protein
MHINTAPAAPAPPPRKPCIRDYAALKRDHFPDFLIRLVPLTELQRRADELRRTHPHFVEELPLVLAGEATRRAVEGGQLAVAGGTVSYSQSVQTVSFA